MVSRHSNIHETAQRHSLVFVGLFVKQLVLLAALSMPEVLAEVRRHGRQSIRAQHLRHVGLVLLEECRQSRLGALLLQRHQLLLARISNLQHVFLGRLSRADRQEADDIGLVDGAQLRVVSPHVTLPVRVVGNVARGDRDRVIVVARVVGTRWRIAELRIEGNTGRAAAVDGKPVGDLGPEALRLDGVFLQARCQPSHIWLNRTE